MNARYEVIHWADEAEGMHELWGGLVPHRFANLAEATKHRTSAGDYVIAVEDGCFARPLNEQELKELTSCGQ